MTKAGKLSSRDMETLNKALEILSRWTEVQEERGNDEDYVYESAMNAVVGLCEFVNNYER